LINEDSKDIGYNAGMTSYIRKFLSLFKANWGIGSKQIITHGAGVKWI
jgi:hypothetical protein